jgi:outer membrane biosynthesis protein TonB
MRTSVILFATLLTATAAAAAPRSLSTGEPTIVELPAQKVQVLEAPRVDLAPTAQTDTTRTTPAAAPQPETKATETAPPPAPVVTAPPPAETKPVVAAPTVQPAPVQTTPSTRPVKQATVQRKPKQRQAGGVYIPRELRGIERTIGISIGAAALSYGLANVPYYW